VSLPKGDVKQLTHDLSSYRSVLNASGEAFLTVELRQTNNVWVAPWNDLSALRQVTFGTFGRYDGLWGLDWTADGKIVFTSTDNKSQVISTMNADGSDVRQLTTPGYNDSMVNASSDGKYIVFQSTRAGGSDIWRMNADGSDIVRITSDGKSSQPFISPDSRFVYYRCVSDGAGHLRRVSIDGGEPERITDVDVSYASLSPDGNYVAAAIGSKLAVFSTNGGPPEKTFELTRFGTSSTNTLWSPDGNAIAYRDRGYGYWLQPIDGSAPKRMEGLPMEKFYNFAWSKDGKHFAFVRGQEIRDVVLFRRVVP
jgi:Tol biopolymer transport system component